MVKSDAQKIIQKLTQEIAEYQKKNQKLTEELEEFKTENADLSRICNEWVPHPSVLPLQVAVKQDLLS